MSLIPRNSLFGLNSFFDDPFPAYRLLPEQQNRDFSSLAVDINETDDSYFLKADFPGVNKDDISVTLEKNTLTLSAEYKEEKEEKDQGRVIRQERRYGRYSRSFNLGQDVDESNIKASFENGVLTLELPKAKQQVEEGKRIPIG